MSMVTPHPQDKSNSLFRFFSTPLEGALWAVEKGLCVSPVTADQKFPPLTSWKETSTRNKAAVLALAEKYPGCNWLVDCGKSTLAVLDEDVKNGKDGKHTTFMLALEHGTFDETTIVQTPSGGRQWYFWGMTRNSVQALGDGVDTRGQGGYVVCPGSTVGGVPYYLLREQTFQDLPAWINDALKKRQSEGGAVEQVPVVDQDLDTSIAVAKAYLATTAPCIEGQGGDARLLQVAAKLKDIGVSENTAVDLILEIFNERCVPSWDSDDVERKVANAFHYCRENKPGVDAPENMFPEDMSNDPLAVKVGEPLPGAGKSFYDIPDRQSPVGQALAEVAAEDAEAKGVKKRIYHSFEEGKGAKTYTAGDTKDWVPKPTEWILPGWIPKGKVTLCSGNGGTAKSLCWLQYAYSLAAGVPVMGIPSTGRIPCIFVSCEDDMDELIRRQHRWADYIDVRDTEEEEVPFMFLPRIVEDSFLCVRGRDGRMVPGPFYAKLAYILSQVPESFVVLDTAGDVFGGNEIVKEEVLDFLKRCLGTLSAKFGTTFLILGHTSRAEGSEFAGSAAWRHGVRSHLFMSWAEDKIHLTLSVRKSNYAAAGAVTNKSFHFLEEVLVETEGMFDDSAEAAATDYVFAAISAEAAKGEPLSLATQAARSLCKVKIFDGFGAPIPDKVKIRAANDLISQGRVIQIAVKRRSAGLFPATW